VGGADKFCQEKNKIYKTTFKSHKKYFLRMPAEKKMGAAST